MSDASATPTDAPAVPARGSRWRTAAKMAAALVVVAALLLAGRQLSGYLEGFTEWIEGLGAWAPVVFMIGYAVATVAFIPGSVLTLASGALFGLVWGTVYAWTGATVGAGAAFLVARYAARGWVERKLEGKPTFAHLDESIEKDGGKIVALLRLAPVFPFVLLNYALGLTKVRFAHYMVASLAMIPGTLLYVYYGHVGRAALEGGQTVWDWVLLGVGLVAVLAVTVVITQKARRALAERTALEESEVGGE
jgi:uncharacterized membrane protein YdjX (TVP38/TMEM64 family)